MTKPSFLKHAAVYALGDLLSMGAGFVLLPIYSRALKAEGFGGLEILERLGEIITICLLARGIALAAMALYAQSKDDAERRRVVSAGLLVTTTMVGAGAILGAVTIGPLSGLLHLPAPFLVWLAVVAALIDGVTVVVQATNQARMDSVFYASISLSQFVTRIGLTLWFVVGLGWGLEGVVVAGVLRAIFFAILVVSREAWRWGLSWPDNGTIWQMVKFALPFLPTGLCMFMLNSGDRFFLKEFSEDAVLGYYGLGYKLASLVGFFSLTPLYRVWSARMYQVAKQADAPEVFGRVITRILAAYLFVGLALCLFSEEVIRTFSQPEFLPACAIIPLIVLANWFQAAGVLMEGGFYIRRQTHWKLWVTVASTLVITVLYRALIPTYGAMGAAVATLGGFMFHAALTYCFAQRAFPVRYEFGRLTVLLIVTILLWQTSALMGTGPQWLVARVGLLAAAPAILWAIGVFSTEEKHLVAQVLRSIVELARSFGRRLTKPQADEARP